METFYSPYDEQLHTNCANLIIDNFDLDFTKYLYSDYDFFLDLEYTFAVAQYLEPTLDVSAHSFSSDASSDSFSVSVMTPNTSVHSDVSHKSGTSLSKIIQTDKKGRPTFDCPVCFKCGLLVRGKNEHMNTHDPHSRRFYCEFPMCFKSYTRSNGLKEHCHRNHNRQGFKNNKPAKTRPGCPACGRSDIRHGRCANECGYKDDAQQYHISNSSQ